MELGTSFSFFIYLISVSFFSQLRMLLLCVKINPAIWENRQNEIVQGLFVIRILRITTVSRGSEITRLYLACNRVIKVNHYFHVEQTLDCQTEGYSKHVPAFFFFFSSLESYCNRCHRAELFCMQYRTGERLLNDDADQRLSRTPCVATLYAGLPSAVSFPDIQKRVFFGLLPSGYSHTPANDQILTLQPYLQDETRNMLVTFLIIEQISSSFFLSIVAFSLVFVRCFSYYLRQ